MSPTPTWGRTLLVFLCLPGCALPVLERHDDSATRFSEFVGWYLESPPTREPDRGSNFRFSAEGDSMRIADARRKLTRLRSIDTSDLTMDDRVDWLLIEADLKRTLRSQHLRLAEREPWRYLPLGSLEWMIAGRGSADTTAWRNVLRTLDQALSAMEVGRRRLIDPPRLWRDLAVRTTTRYETYLADKFPGLVRQKSPVGMSDSLLESGRSCQEALVEFRSFLVDSLSTGPESSWAVGEEHYNWLLREYHFLSHDVESMIAIGREQHDRTKQELRDIAGRSGGGVTWKDLVAEMKGRHPEPFRIAEEYIGESRRAREMLVRRNMIAIPPAETLLFVPTPPALRETYAWGGYGGIEMRDSISVGRFFVTDVDSAMSAEEIEEKLRTQNTGWITPIALHEGYPGHHLQNVYARKNTSKVRSRLGSTYFGEGWALYCESWMGKEGFYVDRWDSLGWFNMRLWRTARVIIDPSLHTGRMTYEDAVDFFIEEVGLERSAAEAEVNRYTTWPTQAPSYIIGWLELEDLKVELQQTYGGSVTDREFAESVLERGSLPPKLLKRSLRAFWDRRMTTGPNLPN